jgi:hypothetical protein
MFWNFGDKLPKLGRFFRLRRVLSRSPIVIKDDSLVLGLSPEHNPNKSPNNLGFRFKNPG